MLDKEELLNRCKLNDLIENYGEMFEYLKELSLLWKDKNLFNVKILLNN